MDENAIASGANADLLEVLERTEFFSSLSAEQYAKLAEISEPQLFNKSARIYDKNDPPDAFFVLVEGAVQFSLHLGGGSASAGEIIRRGDVFGWAALVEGATSRLASAQSLTEARVLSIDGKRLIELMDGDTSMGYLLMKRLNALISGDLNHFVAG
jgi:toluene monooxygenase system ferredoxin subunit